MKINAIILGGVGLQILASLLLFISVTASSATVYGPFIPASRWWIPLYNFGWSFGLLYIKMTGRSKSYHEWIMINSVYQFFLNSSEISGTQTTGLFALYDSGLYISIVAQAFIVCHLYLPSDAYVKVFILSHLEKIQFNVISPADIQQKQVEQEQIENPQVGSNDALPDDPFDDKARSKTRNSPSQPVIAKEEPVLNKPMTEHEENQENVNVGTSVDGESLFAVELTDIEKAQVNDDEKEQVIATIKARGDMGILLSELQNQVVSKSLLIILKVLEFEDRVVYSEKTENDVKFIFL